MPRPTPRGDHDRRRRAQARALFEQRYGAAAAPVAVEIGRRVIGGDWGANGYTTMTQADQLAAGLQLSAADRLLDVGTGRGWPGLYLAARSGCRVVLADLPLEGLRSPPPAPRRTASRPAAACWSPPPAGSPSTPAASTPSSTPRCCADRAPSSPC